VTGPAHPYPGPTAHGPPLRAWGQGDGTRATPTASSTFNLVITRRVLAGFGALAPCCQWPSESGGSQSLACLQVGTVTVTTLAAWPCRDLVTSRSKGARGFWRACGVGTQARECDTVCACVNDSDASLRCVSCVRVTELGVLPITFTHWHTPDAFGCRRHTPSGSR
jgi:hypothetical protein